MKKLFTLVLASLMGLNMMAKVDRPKLVVGLMVDQMRWDYLYYYYDKFGEGGLRRLVDEGHSFENTMINYVPTVTAIGHSSVYTGSVPALTGIAGNSFYLNGNKITSVTDPSVQTVGSNSKEGQTSPRNLLTTTIGDMLKTATDYQAKVIGIALKDRAAILPAGHGADAAYWWDTSAGHFITSTYYMTELPDWVKKTNKLVAVKPGTDVKTSVEGVTKTFQMAEAALRNEQMGKDDITDLLAVSVSSTDAIGHEYGTRGEENYAVYMELDRQLSKFFSILDTEIGKGNYLLFFTADHGAAHNPNVLKKHKIRAGGLELWEKLPKIEQELQSEFGIGEKIILDEDANRIYLNHDAIAKSGKSLDDVKKALIEKLEKVDHVLYAVDYDKVLTTSIPLPIRERIVNGYHINRSGDIFVVAEANWENVSNGTDYRGTTHGMWNPYDSHIPFVLIGWNVTPGQSHEQAHIVDIAPTICAMLHIQMPDACVGHALLP